MPKYLRALIISALAIGVMSVAAAAASAGTITLSSGAGTTGTASGTQQTLTYLSTTLGCTPNFTFSITTGSASGTIGTLIDMAHVNTLAFSCVAPGQLVSLNSAADPVVLGGLTAATNGSPGTVSFTALNVKVHMLAPIVCLFTGSINVTLTTTGTFQLNGGTLNATPVSGDSPTCISTQKATVNSSSYTTTPAITANVSGF